MSTAATQSHDEITHDLRVLLAERDHLIRQDPAALTPASALAMRNYLRGRPFKGHVRNGAPVQHVPGPGGDAHRRPAAKPLISDQLAERLNQEAEEKDAAYQRHAASQRQPVADIGYFEHAGRLYKVVKSVYGANPGRLYAKVLSTETGDWTMARGMLGQLSETERVDPAAGSELGRLLAGDPGSALYGKCWICKRPLTDENSLREGKGPGPHVGYGD